MLGRLGLFGALMVLALAGKPAAAAGLTLDRSQTLDQVLADCDRATGLPHGLTPPPPLGERRKIVLMPEWLRRPSATDIAAVYPAAARSARVSGKALVRCVVGADGLVHDCQVTEETPAGMGFADAARQLAAQMLFVPKRIDCAPVDGGQVSIPFAFAPS